MQANLPIYYRNKDDDNWRIISLAVHVIEVFSNRLLNFIDKLFYQIPYSVIGDEALISLLLFFFMFGLDKVLSQTLSGLDGKKIGGRMLNKIFFKIK
jgi:hypothetical protein